MFMLQIVFLDQSTLGQVSNLDRLRELGEFTGYDHTPPEAVAERVRDANVIISNKVRLTRDNLPAAKNLRLICVAATGMNNVDQDYCRERSIAVRNVVNYSTDSVAQFTWSVLLTLLHRTPALDAYVKSGHYSRQATFSYWASDFWDISGKRFGIIGLGHIGRRVAEIARAFGAKVVYYSTSGRNDDADFRRVELEELLRSCDLISIHAPLNERTRHLIGYAELAE